ncbi:vWA domain-containing protein [Caminicella sporogenes]|uniref:vWA domain-containing protein n=1 Tax=Caminicella sporogenes TaxID=166485 RepID=UPI00253FED3D|nr:BatA and WFA domain-containing protein [Caminicella sporogenes]WIF95427.1 BatA and WFA domain-containing protein [Caminicella sporogenes]
MTFLNPMGLLLGVCLPVIILLYFRKKQVVEIKVSNIKLWDEVIEEVEGIRKRKLDRYLLLIIQLLIGLFLVFVFAHPIYLNKFNSSKVIIGLDVSISMNTNEKGKTHLDMAKDKIINYVNSAPKKTRYTLILLKKNSEVCLEEGIRDDVVRALRKVFSTKEYLDLQNAAYLLSKYDGEKVIVSDKSIMLGDKEIIVGKSLNNVGIVGADYDPYRNEVLCHIKNYCSKSKKIRVCMKSNTGKVDIQSIVVSSNMKETLFFSIDKKDSYVVFNIENKDDLEDDNSYILAFGDKYKKKVLYIGSNIFIKNALESILNLRFDILDKIAGKVQNYDAYIVENEIDISKLPQDASVWVMKPSIKMIEKSKEGLSKVVNKGSLFTKNLFKNGISAADVSILNYKSGYNSVLEVDNKPVMIYGLENGFKRIYSSIDFYKTDMVMKPDFPVFIYKTIEWLLDGYNRSYVSGDKIYFTNDKYKKADLFLWNKKIAEIKLNIPYILNETGIYTLKNQNEEIQSFVVNVPSKFIFGEEVRFESKNKSMKYGIIDLSNIFILLALFLLVIEWEVYKRGY